MTGHNPTPYEAHSLFVDDDHPAYVADSRNDRIVAWKYIKTNGPIDAIIDKEVDNLIICAFKSHKVVRWPRRNGTSGETIILNIVYVGLTMDDNGSLCVTDASKNQVRRCEMEKSQETIVTVENEHRNHLDQLGMPCCISVDQDHSVSVSDCKNQRVMKWIEGANEDIVVAGGQGQGNSLSQLCDPLGVLVDQLGTVYVDDHENHRIVRWPKGTKQRTVIVDNMLVEDKRFNSVGRSIDMVISMLCI